MTGWSSKPEWPSKIEWPSEAIDKLLKETPVITGIDLGAGSQTILTTFEDGKLKSRIVTSEELYDPQIIKNFKLTDSANMSEPLARKYNNKMPTHDPYTNPNAQLYYECKCGAILDPGTKSFAALNNAASDKGWKVRWKQNGEGYEPFCVECGKDVE